MTYRAPEPPEKSLRQSMPSSLPSAAADAASIAPSSVACSLISTAPKRSFHRASSVDPPETTSSEIVIKRKESVGIDPAEFLIESGDDGKAIPCSALVPMPKADDRQHKSESRKSKSSKGSSLDSTPQHSATLGAVESLVPYHNPSIKSDDLFDAPPPVSTICDSYDNANDNALVLRDDPKYGEGQLVAKQTTEECSLRRGFDHCFVSVPTKDRLSALFATLRRNSERKMVVLFNTWESAKFHALLFRQLELLPVHEMHESMEDVDVVNAHDRYLYCYPGILFASDIAMREFDIPPNVDYIIQYDPPMDPTEYIYRVSNAKIFHTSCHKALLFLSPEAKEMEFMRYFDSANVKVNELQARRVSEFQDRVEKLVMKHTDLNEVAWRAFRAHMVAYGGHSHKDVYDVEGIDEGDVRRSFARPHYPAFVVSQQKEDTVVMKEYVRAESGGDGHRHHRCESSEKNIKFDKSGMECNDEEEVPKHAKWARGKEKTWRKGHTKSWMTKEKTWKHSHVNL